MSNGSTAIEGLSGSAGSAAAAQTQAEGVHRLGDVLELLAAEIVELDIEPAANLVAHGARDVDAAGLGQPLQARRHVDPIAEDVVAADHDVAEVDADAELHAAALGQRGVARAKFLLHLDRAAHRFDDARELGEDAVAGRADDAPVVRGDEVIEDLAIGVERS